MRSLSRRRRLGGLAIASWFGVMVTISAALLAKHLVAMPTPSRLGGLERSLSALRHPDEQGWVAFHALYAECRCSQRIADELASTERPRGFTEIVLWVGEAPPPEALAARFDVRRITPAELASYGIEAAPLLVALDPGGHARYAGGYTSRKQGPEIVDRRLLEDARTGRDVEPLPLFGCATSDGLRRQLSLLPSL